MEPFLDYSLRLNLIGGGQIDCLAGEMKTHIFPITKTYYITGAEYFKTGNKSDRLCLRIKSGGIIQDHLVNRMFMGDHGVYEFYKATVHAGMEIEVEYENLGSNPSSLTYNLILHEDK